MQQTEVTVTLHTIIIKDASTGEAFSVRTVRTAQAIANFLEESEKDEMIGQCRMP